MKLWFLDLGFL